MSQSKYNHEDFLALPAEAQTTKADIVSAYSINIDQGCHTAKMTLPTQGAKDSNKKVFITDQTHVKKIARCHPHSPLITQIGEFFTKLLPSSQPVSLSLIVISL